MLQEPEFLSEVDGYITTGDISPEGIEARVTGSSPFFSRTGVTRFVIHESENEEGYCNNDLWIVPVHDIDAVRQLIVQVHKEDDAHLLVLSIYNEGDPFENPEIAIEIDRMHMHG